METKEKEIWYALRCNGVYEPFLYAVDDNLDKDRIRPTEEECQILCNELNSSNEEENENDDVVDKDTLMDIIHEALQEHDINHEYNCGSIYIIDKNDNAVMYVNVEDCENV